MRSEKEKRKGVRGHNTPPDELKRRYDEVSIAIEEGALSYTKIRTVTKLSIQQIQNLFKHFPDLHEKYRRAVAQIRLIASGNIIDAICDPTNPKHYEASKWFATHYKGQLDEEFEKQDDAVESTGISIEEEGESKRKINITFSPQNKRTKED